MNEHNLPPFPTSPSPSRLKRDKKSFGAFLRWLLGLPLRGVVRLFGRHRGAFIALGILFVSVGFFWVMSSNRPTASSTPHREASWFVETLPARHQTIAPRFLVFGQVQASRQVDLTPSVSGKIIEVWEGFREGADVEQDTVLVRIDRFDYISRLREAEASLAEARSRLKESLSRLAREKDAYVRAQERLTLKERDMERAHSLLEEGFLSEKSMDNLSLDYNRTSQELVGAGSAVVAAQEGVEQLRSTLKRLEIAVLRAKRDVEDTEVKAPFDGFVGSVRVGRGQEVGPSFRLGSMVDKNSLEVRFNVSGQALSSLVAKEEDLLNAPAKILWRVGEDALTFDATIERMGASVLPSLGGVDFFASLGTLPDGSFLRPGAFVEVVLEGKSLRNVLAISSEALFEENTLYVVNSDNRLQPRLVEVMGASGDEVFVRGDIKEGEKILITRFPEAGQGIKVRVVQSQNTS